MTISVNGGSPSATDLSGATAGCANDQGDMVCTVLADAPPGTQSFTVKTFDAYGGQGNVLSVGTASATITQGQVTPIPVELSGAVTSITLTVNPVRLTIGHAATASVVVSALDADEDVIDGTGPFSDTDGGLFTITLSDSDTTGATTLSATQLASPADSPVTLSYTGLTPSTFVANLAATPSDPNLGAAHGVFAAQPVAYTLTTYPIPTPASGPDSITVGPDGAAWFLETYQNANQVGRVDPTSGAITEYPLPAVMGDSGGRDAGVNPGHLVTASDGLMYFTGWGDYDFVHSGFPTVLYSVSTSGTVTQVPTLPTTEGGATVFGSRIATSQFGTVRVDVVEPNSGQMWIVDQTGAAEGPYTPAATAMTVDANGVTWWAGTDSTGQQSLFNTTGASFALTGLSASTYATFMTTGPNGTVWISYLNEGGVYEFDPGTGTLRNFQLVGVGDVANELVGAGDGAIWATEPGSNGLVRVTSFGGSDPYSTQIGGANISPVGIAVGSDLTVWATDNLNNSVIRATPQ
ncbi:MAG: hypothetical protein JST54_25365 [Deltaproteobacteria bacterium]|nr:hypothetical protein [Deltaproteobacteria bacterium]